LAESALRDIEVWAEVRFAQNRIPAKRKDFIIVNIYVVKKSPCL
jgi:hypothetical protein